MIHPKAIDHATLFVTDLGRAKAYYERLFDFACTLRESDASTLVIESESVHFFLVAAADIPIEFIQRQHISFAVEDLQPVIDQLQALEIPYQSGAVEFFEYRNYRWCEWRDPDGIRLECVESI